MKINFNIQPQNSIKDEPVYNNREVVILNRKYKCKCFLSQEDVDDYLIQHPSMEVLSTDEEGINIIPLDYYGVEVVFLPYEFKRYEIEKIGLKPEVVKKPSRITWISEETTIKLDTKKKS